MKKYMHRTNNTINYSKCIDWQFKKISPMQYMKMDCEDITTDFQNHECYKLLKNKIQFNKMIDIIKLHWNTNYKDLLTACNTILYVK